MPELPLEIWKDRIENELKSIKNLKVLKESSIVKQDDVVEFMIILNSLGFIESSEGLIPKRSHRILLKLNRSFPYPGGIDFSWLSNLFHPNIHPIELSSETSGTGYICLNVLKKWSRLSDLETTIKALKLLVENPNSDDPLNYTICLRAAEYYKKNPIENLKKQFGIDESEDKTDELDDDIIMIDD
ncbi:MAG: ubiquitin-conjugating enzyme E2 [Promethearchaeota archaeon]